MTGSQDMIIIVVMMMMMSSVFAVLAGGAYFMTKPQEGDECKGTSVGGNYVIDEDGDCVLDYCDSGYTQSGGGCVVVVPDGNEDESGSGGGGGGGGGLPMAQYVRVERPSGDYPGNIINLGEIEVFDEDDNNISLNAPVTGGPAGAHSAGPYYHLTDGNYAKFAHTTGDGVSFLEVDLGAAYKIKKVVITNRSNCCQYRLADAVLILKGVNSEQVQVTPSIDTEKMKMTWDFSSETPEWLYTDV
jgi:hypothetical protein